VGDICGGYFPHKGIHKWFSRKGYNDGTHSYRAECGAEMTFPPGSEVDDNAIFSHTYEKVTCFDCRRRAPFWKLTGETGAVPDNRRREAVMATRLKNMR